MKRTIDEALAERALLALVSTVEATGGLIRYASRDCGCAGDEDWIDLADAYELACVALGRKPVIQDRSEDVL